MTTESDPDATQLPRKRWREVLISVAIIAVVAALLVPPAHWASSDTVKLPVTVYLFDISSGQPIAGAEVRLASGPMIASPVAIEEQAAYFHDLGTWTDSTPRPGEHGVTDTSGFVTLSFEFSTSASHLHPRPSTFPGRSWIHAEAPTYGQVLTTAGQIPVATATVRKQGEFLIPIGLSPALPKP